MIDKTTGISEPTLIERLRGKYPIGPIQEDGEPEFAYRVFDGLPPIHAEAADELERLTERNKKLERVCEAAKKYIQARDDIERFALICYRQTKLREAIAEVDDHG